VPAVRSVRLAAELRKVVRPRYQDRADRPGPVRGL